MEWSLYLCLSICVVDLPIASYWTDQLFFPPSHANPVGMGAVLCRPVSGSTVPCFDELFAARPHELFLAAEVGAVPQPNPRCGRRSVLRKRQPPVRKLQVAWLVRSDWSSLPPFAAINTLLLYMLLPATSTTLFPPRPPIQIYIINLMSYLKTTHFTAVSVGFQLDASDLRFLPPR